MFPLQVINIHSTPITDPSWHKHMLYPPTPNVKNYSVGSWVRWIVAHTYKHAIFNCKCLSPLGGWVDESVGDEVSIDHESSRTKLS